MNETTTRRRGGRQPVAADSYEGRAKAATKDLAKAGRRLDTARRKAAAALGELRDAEAAWDSAVQGLSKQPGVARDA